ncbi:MAG: dicarboxylate/amino acid:cation symporter [Hyphomonadaceae bacterium]|nr:dicarboxylate/amino acid:cation symporter [Hyphomonadaceae bacterium]
MSRNFSLFILLAMILGVGAGWWINTNMAPAAAEETAGNLKIVTDVFLRLIKMIIAPLVFSTLVAGIAHMGSAERVGRIGVRTLAWFIGASIVSLTLGAVMVTLFQPGAGLNLPLPPEDADVGVKAAALNIKDFVTHVVPTSIADAMAKNEILQIVVFSVFIGVAIASLNEKAKLITHVMEQVVEVMLKVTGYVMLVAPFAVFAAIAAAIAQHGLDILWTYGKFVGTFYLSLGLLWVLLVVAGLVMIGPRMFGLVAEIREPVLLAFSTSSSEAAFPRTIEALRRFGVPKRISGFVLPLGYSFNLDGSMMYCTFATLFIAQIYGITLSTGQIITMLGLLMVTSKGIAGVPRASLVVIAATLPTFGIPGAGLLLIFAIDQFLDMGRSATNVVGNAVASAVAAKWEGELKDGPADEDGVTAPTYPLAPEATPSGVPL